MWEEHRSRGGEKPRVDARFVLVDIETGGEQSPRLERGAKRFFVDHRPPGSVDEDRGRLHESKPAGVDQMARLGGERHVQAHHVGNRQQAVELDHAALEPGRSPGMMEHPHRESLRAPRYRPSDTAVADQAEGGAVHVPTEIGVELPIGPPSRPQVAFGI